MLYVGMLVPSICPRAFSGLGESLDFVDYLSDVVECAVAFCCDFSQRPAVNEVVSGHHQFGSCKFLAVSQAHYVFAAGESPYQSADFSGDVRLIDAREASQLAKAVAVLKIHRHQEPVFAAEQAYATSHQLNSIPVGASCRRSTLRYVFVDGFHR
jgi:hypothetical protein